MSKLRRYYSQGNIYFVTIVTFNRSNILDNHQELFLESMKHFKNVMNFKIIAYVILPNHIHLLIDPKQNNLSIIIQKIKLSFHKKYNYFRNTPVKKIWQSRFWDHVIRNESDLANHFDYIHYNPVKHRYVHKPIEWKYSSFNNFFEKGYYSDGWGVNEKLSFDGKFGE